MAWKEKVPISKEEIENLENAIKKDNKERKRYEKNQKEIEDLQRIEATFKEELLNVQKSLVDKLELKFDLCDKVAIEIAIETLRILKERFELGLGRYADDKAVEIAKSTLKTVKERYKAGSPRYGEPLD